MERTRYLVVGGGIAGLVAANALAGKCDEVILIEQGRQTGGRALTHSREGFQLNLGPHALYRHGPLFNVLTQWGIPFSGRIPSYKTDSWLMDGSKRIQLFSGVTGLLTSAGLGIADKLAVARVMRRLAMDKAASVGAASVSQWLDEIVGPGLARRTAEALLRVSTYSDHFTEMTARHALEQFQMAMKHAVLYLDGGWKTIVDGLAKRAMDNGVTIRASGAATRVSPGEVTLASGETISGDGVILAVAPRSVERLTGRSLPPLLPVRAACLDICLSRLPTGAAKFALGLDRPYYFSVHSATANLAPEGSALVHVAKYLNATTASSRDELESFADLVMPGWRSLVRYQRYLPDMHVTHAVQNGQRPGANVLGLPRVMLAGDWVGPRHMLADCAAASALHAAELVQAREMAAA
jgi:phytoene dehydrogenase-like protein